VTCRLFAVAAVLVLVPSDAFGHAIGVEAKLKGDRVAIEAYYDDDTPGADAKVTVIDGDGKVVAEGMTDAKGNWSFPIPSPGKYRVAVDAGGGHLAKTTITIPPGSVTTSPAPTGTASTTDVGAAPEVVVSDGPTREETTGPRRWLMAGVGIALIGVLTWGAKLAARRKSQRQTTEAAR